MPGSHLALDVLALIAIVNEQQAGYDRDLFGYAGDLDGDGCDTRAEVLIRDSRTPAQVDPAGCGVIAGDWRSAYDGLTWSDPAELEIDHVVALKEAHDSGAWAWQPNRLVAFGNDLDDPRTLRAVTAAVNRAKSDADPSNWLPPDETYLCTYLGDHLDQPLMWIDPAAATAPPLAEWRPSRSPKASIAGSDRQPLGRPTANRRYRTQRKAYSSSLSATSTGRASGIPRAFTKRL